MDNWIDVTDRLPKSKQDVLLWVVAHIYEGVDLGYLHSGEWITYGDRYQTTVTHWMPLPNPPKTDSNG
jgi:hypothetical protein